MTAPKRTIVKLKQAESIALADWLRQGSIAEGATYKTLARRAANELGNERINANHIDGLMTALGMELPRAPRSVEASLARLEEKLDVVIREQIRLCKEYGVIPSEQLIALASGD